MNNRPNEPLGKILALTVLFVLIGIPLVAYLWDTLNKLLALEVDPIRLVIAVPIFLILVGLLILLARSIRRWAEGEGG